MDSTGSKPARISDTWQVVLSPIDSWPHLTSNSWLPALVWQLALLMFSFLLSEPAYNDTHYILFGKSLPPFQAGRIAGTFIATALGVIVGNLALAGAIFGSLRLLGHVQMFNRCFTFASVSIIPVVLGQALGRAIFALLMPLPADGSQQAEVIAWHLRPFSAGLLTWLPHPPEALSLPWALLGMLDLFGLWTLALAFIGSGLFLGVPRLVRPWFGLMLMLVFLSVAFGLWQAGQSQLAALK